jgi:eukaryotic-like serine/threonine-protein kinase
VVAPQEHSIIAGKYRLIRQLGQGGMGSVWLAEHLTLCSQVAIKLIHVDIASSAEVLGRFLREAQAAASLRSPHVVQILDHGVDHGTPYIAMELLDGESLADRLTRVGRLEPAVLARIMTQIGRAIGRAHEAGIVHRDLKPDNVFLVRNDDDEITKVLDFGIAKSTLPGAGSLGAAPSSGTRTGAVLGTPYYMSPEQAEGARSLDHRSDIWAMGVIAFECLLGRRPFDAETLGGLLLAICTRPIPIPSQYGPVPPGFDAWFERVCNRDLAQRFGSARDAALELKRVCDGYVGPVASHGRQAPGAASAADISGPVSAVSEPFRGPALAVPNQSVAGLSATQLEAAPSRKRNSKRALVALFSSAAVVIVGALLAWSQFKSEAVPIASTNATSSNALAPASTSAASRPVENALSVEVTPVPAQQASAAVAVPVQAAAVASASSSARPAVGVRAPVKRPPPAAVAPNPARTATSTPTVKPPARPAVNLGI